ncbi:cellulase family glycosylhydrolase [Polaribacter sp.]|uniref:cellulase family glycosylhydrolase n=1 Tax=Polaribacter sp. TaxID=1920175 RepID=UPI003F69D08F
MLSKALFFLLFISSMFVFGQISPDQMIVKMNRGINLGNILSAPSEGNWAPALTESYLDDVKSVGFKTVRIPIDFLGDRTSGNTAAYSKLANTANSYTGSESDYIINNTYLDRVDEVITWSLERGLMVILDFHGKAVKEEFLYTFSSKSKWAAYYTSPTSAKRAADNQKFRAIWKQIAERFKSYSDNLVFEIINEPYFWLSDAEMDVLNTDIISIIRNSGSKNTTRNIIITGGSKNANEAPLQISNTVLNSDNYLIGTFHYYKPRSFTASSEQDHNYYSWGSTADKTEIDTHFLMVKNWSDANNIPVLLGEFGADNTKGIDYSSNILSPYGGPEDSSRVAFHKYIADKALALGFAFTVWDAGDQSNKTVYKVSDRSWVSNVRNALLGVNCLKTDFIENADIECGQNSIWSLQLEAPAIAQKNIANETDSRSFSNTLEVNVTNAGSSFNKTILKNKEVNVTNLIGNTYNFSLFGKASTNNQQFKIRIKSTSTSNAVSFQASPVFNLTSNNYNLFSFEYTIPQETEKIEFQVICGKQAGKYFFDDFFTENLNTLSAQDYLVNQTTFKIYPNPSKGILNINSNKEIVKLIITNALGKTIYQNKIATKKIDTTGLPKGIYFLKAIFNDASHTQIKFLTL